MNASFRPALNRVTYFTIQNSAAARRLVNSLIKTPNDSLILPFIEYPEAPLFNEILTKDFRILAVCDRDEERRQLFHRHIKRKFPRKNIKIYPDDLFDLSFKKYCNESQRRCSTILKEILENQSEEPFQNKGCDNQIKMLVPLLLSKHETGFLKNLYSQVSLRLGMCSSSVVDYYFLMSDREYNYLKAQPLKNLNLYRPSTVLNNTIFDHQVLDSFELKSCFGVSLNKIQKTSASTKSLYSMVHLVWLRPKLEVINKLEPENLLEFRFLINQVMHRRSGPVLPLLEKWFHDCGKDISYLGIDETTISGGLNSEQYYRLFLYLKSRPDYRNSTFLNAAACADENISLGT